MRYAAMRGGRKQRSGRDDGELPAAVAVADAAEIPLAVGAAQIEHATDRADRRIDFAAVAEHGVRR